MILLGYFSCIQVLLTFWFIGMNDTSARNLGLLLAGQYLTSLVSSSYGFMVGCIFNDFEAAKSFNGFSIMVFSIVGGGYANANTFPVYMLPFAYISHMRYGLELVFRRLVEGHPDAEGMIEFSGLTYGEPTCFAMLAGLLAANTLLGLIALVLKSRKM